MADKARNESEVLHLLSLWHPRFQSELRPIHDKDATSLVMDGFGPLLRCVDPGLDDFYNEDVVFIDKTWVPYPAFEVGETFGHKRRGDFFGRHRRETEGRELVNVASG